MGSLYSGPIHKSLLQPKDTLFTYLAHLITSQNNSKAGNPNLDSHLVGRVLQDSGLSPRADNIDSHLLMLDVLRVKIFAMQL